MLRGRGRDLLALFARQLLLVRRGQQRRAAQVRRQAAGVDTLPAEEVDHLRVPVDQRELEGCPARAAPAGRGARHVERGARAREGLNGGDLPRRARVVHRAGEVRAEREQLGADVDVAHRRGDLARRGRGRGPGERPQDAGLAAGLGPGRARG